MTFDEFFTDRYEHVRRGVYLAVRRREVADEAAQEAFARAFARWSRVRGMERPGAWVFVVAMNVARRQLRRGVSTVARPSGQAVEAPDTAAAVTVRDALAGLPDRQRAVVVLRYYGDLRLADIAEALNMAVGTVKSTLHAAHQKLEVELAEEHADSR